MKSISLLLLLMLTLNIQAQSDEIQSIYQFDVVDLYGEPFHFADMKGKKIMVVNTASKCGLTPQYKDLQKLYNTYRDKDFVIVGFPANNFLRQEPGSDEEIAQFCEKNYGVTFPMMSKISVKGKDIHPLYSYLTEESRNGLKDSEVKWNFQKFLIDENGFLIDVLDPRTSPMDAKILDWLEGE